MRLLIILLFSISITSKAQQTILIRVKGEGSKTGIAATIMIKENSKGYSTDTLGNVSIPFSANGNYTLAMTAVGYEGKKHQNNDPIQIRYVRN